MQPGMECLSASDQGQPKSCKQRIGLLTVPRPFPINFSRRLWDVCVRKAGVGNSHTQPSGVLHMSHPTSEVPSKHDVTGQQSGSGSPRSRPELRPQSCVSEFIKVISLACCSTSCLCPTMRLR